MSPESMPVPQKLGQAPRGILDQEFLAMGLRFPKDRSAFEPYPGASNQAKQLGQ